MLREVGYGGRTEPVNLGRLSGSNVPPCKDELVATMERVTVTKFNDVGGVAGALELASALRNPSQAQQSEKVAHCDL